MPANTFSYIGREAARAPSTQSGTVNERRTIKPAHLAVLPYCGKVHSIVDGLPVAHRCHLIPPEAISAAISGDFVRAITLLAQAAARGPLPDHPGIWKVRRR
jgi:hypothetical protein